MAFPITFGFHAGLTSNFFKLPISDFLIFSYKFNFGITLLFMVTMILFDKKFHDQIGFIFLAGSALKLMLFMAISYLNGFEIGRSTALDFFIPYVICLFVEIFIISKILKTRKNT